MRSVVFVIAALVSLGIVAGSAWAFLLRDADERARRSNLLPTDLTLGPRPAFDVAPPCRNPLTPDEPLRLWIGGDSLAGTLGPALGQLAAETGVVLPTFDYHTSSGLSSPSFFDWPERAAEEIERVDPEVVVFIIGANDTGVVRDEPTNDDGVPEWRDTYGRLVDQMLDLFTDDGRSVYWVGSPTLRDDRKNRAVEQVNDVARERFSERNDATFVDAYDLFSDDGEYTPTRPGVDGDDVRVRTNDGIHFTPAGGELLATYVFAYIDEHCDVERQAVEDRDQPVRQSPGSGEVPGSDDEPASTTQPPTTATTATTAPPSTTTSPPTTIISTPLVAL